MRWMAALFYLLLMATPANARIDTRNLAFENFIRLIPARRPAHSGSVQLLT